MINEKFYKDKVDWHEISFSQQQELSENFIREFEDKVDWFFISCSQKLSENFIREFRDKVDWWGISRYQIISKNFIKEFRYDFWRIRWLKTFISRVLSFIGFINKVYSVKIDRIKYKKRHKKNKYSDKPSLLHKWARQNIIYFKRKPLRGLGLSQFIYRWIGKV